MTSGAFDSTRPFPRWRGLRAGLSRRDLDGPGFRRLFHGVLVSSAVPVTDRLRAEGALVPFFESAFASHATAARLHGVPLPPLPSEHVTVPEVAHRLRRRGIEVHVRPSAAVTVVDGVRVSTLPDLFVELAEQLSLVDLVVAGDWMVRRRRITPGRLRAVAADAPGASGRLARQAAALVREDVDSPMETRLRLLIVLAGLPEPTVNLKVRNEFGEVVRRYDLSWPGIRFAVEYDGRHHVEVVEQWEADLERRADSDDDEWRMLVVISSGIFRSPDTTVRRIHRVLQARRLAGTPVRPSDAWRPHFPGHRDAA